ncbi:acyl carrier protein (plasmid) [Sinorhizobium americanum]|uniref:Acyl carrier protein n=1 Tax=Sinorhizobium americanum TaxID=194963 RepID=A0A1L3LZJ9_9HYPH|nr:acyl carrier protein [Sinorhizobium americanum]
MGNSRAAVAGRVREIIIEQLGVDAAMAVDDASIVDDLCADALELAQIVMMIEDEFDVEIQRLELQSTSL